MESDPSYILERIVKELGVEQIVELLADRIPETDLYTLLLYVFREKTQRLVPSELLKRYQANRSVHPASVDPIQLKQLELDILKIASNHFATPVQLSPVAPLGSCSVVATVDQNKVLSAIRGTEVVSDATNLLALHISDLLKSRKKSNREDYIRLCTTHRHVRTQYFNNPGMFPHFHLFCMVTSGTDTGSYQFEKQSFWEHITVYQDIFQSLFQSDIEVILSGRDGYKDSEGLLRRVAQLGKRFSIKVSIKEPNLENQYYKGLQFTVITKINGEEHNIGDGGFVDWSQKLLGSKKQRLIISAIGLDRLLL
ncbi:hypothetical protein GA0061096_1669 [Fictibacillus enclensis]|uniref:Uncharacterized protein n=1 Tax=Fictibacillus enclensis TaxID=1017270 RepID=A0A0V8JEC6_9BACL|nr:hypothetical protein [Fictibacillus enclensis]KSU85427.1 hypothetical protein AS030_07960 [Fictibacillus enclensis]SCB96525.1 hypothetical protein GA0061096_1669 [Fictibacillus enclensis]